MMWFKLGVQNFIEKNIIHDDSYELYVSDLARIWHALLSNEDILSTSQRLNPLFEASVQKLKEMTSNLLREEKAEKEIVQENDSIILKLKSKSLGFKFMFQIVLHQQNEEVFHKEFTVPLLLMLIQMQKREEKLIKIIMEKDAEIQEYKQEYGVNKCNYMATEPFNKEEFEFQQPVTNICDSNFPFECLNSTSASVKKEPSSSEDSLPDSSEKPMLDIKQTVCKDKRTRSGPKQCIKLEDQTIKRRKKQVDLFKIKF